MLSELRMYGRFVAGLRHFYRQRITREGAARLVRERLGAREASFLSLLERAVYGHAPSPYRALLREAGCEWGDLQHLVHREGLDEALRTLRAAGVFVTFEEFKGRTPLVRGGRTLADNAHAFDNPSLARHLHGETSGTTGAPLRFDLDLDHLRETTPHHALVRAAHGVLEAPLVLWRGILPDGSGINYILRTALLSRPPDRWFSHIGLTHSRQWVKNALATYTFVLASRAGGTRIPFPEYVSLDQAATVARHVRDTLSAHGQCLVSTQVSRALRVGLAAREAGLDLTGATFMIAGEPPTPAKVREIHRSGARTFPTYGMAETGRIGMGCANPNDVNDVHLLEDAFAVITHPQPVEGFDVTVPSFNITTLLPTTPKIMINVISDDYGVIETRSCGCLLEACGFARHARAIRSYRKLTGEGVTLIGSDIVRVLEEVLPARFGGTPLDYQLLEHEDEGGFTRLSLIVSPRVRIDDEQAVTGELLSALSRQSPSADAASAVWRRARTLTVVRREPIWTAAGKFNPLVHAPWPGAGTPDGGQRTN